MILGSVWQHGWQHVGIMLASVWHIFDNMLVGIILIFSDFGVDVSDAEKVKEFFNKLDVDGNSMVTFDEFLRKIQAIQREKAAQNEGERRKLPLETQHPALAWRSTSGAQAAASWNSRWSGRQTQEDLARTALQSARSKFSARPQSAFARLQTQTQRVPGTAVLSPRLEVAQSTRPSGLPGRGLPARCKDLRGDRPWVR